MKKIAILFILALLLTVTASAHPYVIKLIQEGEDIQDISEYTSDKCTIEALTINDARVSQGGYLRILPTKTNGTYNITYNFEGILPGIYNVHVVTLPKTLMNETATDLPVKYKIKLKSGTDDQETETDCGAFESVANEITNNIVEGVEITGNYAKITLSGNASAKKSKTETSEMYLDCIYLEKVIDIPEVTYPNIVVNDTNFPDEKFRIWIFMQSYGSDGVLTPEEISNVTNINVRGKKIQSVKGIEYFTALEFLDCSNNQLTSLDVSENSALTELHCYQNQIKGAGMDALVESLPTVSNGTMYVIYGGNSGNKMTTTQVATSVAKGWMPYYSYNDVWKEYKGYDPLSLEINATNFPDDNFRKFLLQQDYGQDGYLTNEEILDIKNLWINGKKIYNLKGIEHFTSLTDLDCGNNLLTSIDVSKNTALTDLNCSENPLTSVTLGNGMTSIGDNAFYGCSSLTSIEIPNSVTTIGFGAFKGCSGLTGVTIGSGVTLIEEEAFSGCSSLTYITIPNSVTAIGESAFYNCKGLTAIEIPNSVTSIGNSAFSSCTSLTSVTIPNSVTSIGERTFYGCSSLTSVTIPNSVTSIGGYAFQNCSSLTEVHITDIEAWCKIKFGSNPLDYAHHLFIDGKEITDLVIPNSVTTIGERAFSGCSGLTSIDIPNSVTTIGYGAFWGCSGLTEVHITDLAAWCNIKFADSSSNPLYYAHHLFMDDNEIKDLVIPEDVTSIGIAAFDGCSGLTSVTFHNNVTEIGNGAFGDCSSLTSIDIPNSVTTIGYGAFWGCFGLTSVTFPNSVTTIGERAFYNCANLTSVIIGNSVTSIRQETFSDCPCLTSVTIGNSVTTIGYYAFSGCSSLTSIEIPNSVTTINGNAFSGCYNLTSISLGRGIIAIGNAFSDCTNLKDIYCYAEEVPITSNYAFGNIYNYWDGIIYNNATLHVPDFLIEDYRATVPWSYFRNIIELENYDPSPIPEYVREDVNFDGIVNGTDIQAVINAIVNGEYEENADVNEDETVNGTDIQKIINYIVYGPDEDTGDDDDDDDDDSGDDEDEVLDIDETYIDWYLPAIMEKDSSISIFCQALKLTNMDDYLNQYIDHSYSIGLDSVTNGVPGIRFGGRDCDVYYAERRLFKYTAFVETNEVLKKYGINSLEDLIAHAKAVYDETFPGDAGLYDDDYTNRKNPLNRWVSYHLMNRYGNYGDWAPYGEVLAQCCRTDVADAEDFWQTMLHEGMIRFCRAEGQLYANRKGLKNAVSQGLKGVRVLTDDESGDINQQALNGRYFYLEDLLEYSTDVRDKVLNCRMRIDATTLSADFMNQGSRGHFLGDRNDALFGHKRGYIEGWKISPETFVGVHCDNVWWSSYLGNAVAVKGQYDVQIKLPNPPPGLYEIRLAYVAGEERGVVQVYVNNKKCGDPVDFRKGPWEFIEVDQEKLKNDEDYNVSIDKSLRKLGYMLGPDSYGKPGAINFRVDAPEHQRRILTTAQFTEGKDCWLRFQQMIEGNAEWAFDYLELCPVSIINEEDRH